MMVITCKLFSLTGLASSFHSLANCLHIVNLYWPLLILSPYFVLVSHKRSVFILFFRSAFLVQLVDCVNVLVCVLYAGRSVITFCFTRFIFNDIMI